MTQDQEPLYSEEMLANAADNLWLFRVFRSQTHQDLADKVLTAPLLAAYEDRQMPIDAAHVSLIADELRVPLRVLLGPAKFWLLLDTDTRKIIERGKGLP
jgi:hypothetical protein